jgi:hypothetical protein
VDFISHTRPFFAVFTLENMRPAHISLSAFKQIPGNHGRDCPLEIIVRKPARYAELAKLRQNVRSDFIEHFASFFGISALRVIDFKLAFFACNQEIRHVFPVFFRQ